MVLSEIGIAPTRRHPEQLQQIWIDIGKLFGSGHRSKRQTFLSKIFGRTDTKKEFDEYILTGELSSVAAKSESASTSVVVVV